MVAMEMSELERKLKEEKISARVVLYYMLYVRMDGSTVRMDGSMVAIVNMIYI